MMITMKHLHFESSTDVTSRTQVTETKQKKVSSVPTELNEYTSSQSRQLLSLHTGKRSQQSKGAN
jgi:hypothetical protein